MILQITSVIRFLLLFLIVFLVKNVGKFDFVFYIFAISSLLVYDSQLNNLMETQFHANYNRQKLIYDDDV